MKETSYSYKELSKAIHKARTAPIKIYYDRFSGEIIGSCPNDHEAYLEEPSINVAHVLANNVIKSPLKYIVAFDKDTNTIRPVKKNEVIRLFKPDTKLFEIPKIEYISGERLLASFPKPNINPLHMDFADLAVTVYKQDSLLTISLNPLIINRGFNTAIKSSPALLSQLHFEEGSALNLFITKKDNPNAMLKSIYVDLNDFLSEYKNVKTLKYDITDILQSASVDEISIYTRRIFKRYAWQVKDKFIPTHREKGISKPLLDEIKSENYHIVIVAEAPNVLTIQIVNDIELSGPTSSGEFIAFLKHAKNLYSMRTSISIDLKKLIKDKSIMVRTNEMIDDAKHISWRNKNLNIKFIPYASPYN